MGRLIPCDIATPFLARDGAGRFHFLSMNIEPQLIRKREAATFLSMPLSTLEKLTARKKIPHVKIGRAVSYDMTDLRAWIETKKVASLGRAELDSEPKGND